MSSRRLHRKSSSQDPELTTLADTTVLELDVVQVTQESESRSHATQSSAHWLRSHFSSACAQWVLDLAGDLDAFRACHLRPKLPWQRGSPCVGCASVAGSCRVDGNFGRNLPPRKDHPEHACYASCCVFASPWGGSQHTCNLPPYTNGRGLYPYGCCCASWNMSAGSGQQLCMELILQVGFVTKLLPASQNSTSDKDCLVDIISEMLRADSMPPLSAIVICVVSQCIDHPNTDKRDLGGHPGCLLLSCRRKGEMLRHYPGGQRWRVWSGPVDEKVLARRERLDDRLDWDGRTQIGDRWVGVRCLRVGVEVRAHCGLICDW